MKFLTECQSRETLDHQALSTYSTLALNTASQVLTVLDIHWQFRTVKGIATVKLITNITKITLLTTSVLSSLHTGRMLGCDRDRQTHTQFHMTKAGVLTSIVLQSQGYHVT